MLIIKIVVRGPRRGRRLPPPAVDLQGRTGRLGVHRRGGIGGRTLPGRLPGRLTGAIRPASRRRTARQADPGRSNLGPQVDKGATTCRSALQQSLGERRHHPDPGHRRPPGLRVDPDPQAGPFARLGPEGVQEGPRRGRPDERAPPGRGLAGPPLARPDRAARRAPAPAPAPARRGCRPSGSRRHAGPRFLMPPDDDGRRRTPPVRPPRTAMAFRRWIPFWALQASELGLAFLLVNLSIHVAHGGLLVVGARSCSCWPSPPTVRSGVFRIVRPAPARRSWWWSSPSCFAVRRRLPAPCTPTVEEKVVVMCRRPSD